jgi:phospholipid transport system transporter-binding protein
VLLRAHPESGPRIMSSSASTTSTAWAAAELPLVLPAEVSHAQGRSTLTLLDQAIRAQPEGAVLLDASQLQRFDSSVLAVVLACRRSVLAQGRSFAVRNLPPHVRELAALYGVQDLLGAGEGEEGLSVADHGSAVV